MEFVAHLYNDPSFVGTNYMVGAAFEIAPNQIWAGQMLVTATSEVDPTGMVSFFSIVKHFLIVSYPKNNCSTNEYEYFFSVC